MKKLGPTASNAKIETVTKIGSVPLKAPRSSGCRWKTAAQCDFQTQLERSTLHNFKISKLPNVGGKVLDIRNHDGKTGLFLFLANGRDDRSRCGHRSSGED